jgi:hypothetical protein
MDQQRRLDFAIRTATAAARMLAAVMLVIAFGCTEPRGPLSVKSQDPTLKVPAIKQDVHNRNQADVAQMVNDLSDDDPAVRFYASEGLRRLTGETFGYHYYDDEDTRKPAVKRWKQWLADTKKP